MKVKSLSRFVSDRMDCSLPGSTAHGTFPARVLEWVAIAFSDMYASFGLNIHIKNIIVFPINFYIMNTTLDTMAINILS